MAERARVLITGASSGIGAALARAYARRGADLALCARRTDRLEQVAAACRAAGARVLALACDVTRDGDLERAVAACERDFGGLDIAIANAGFAIKGRFAHLTLEDVRRQFETNVFGVVRTAKAALPALARTRGRLAIVGSAAGHLPGPGAAPYSMSKAAVGSLAESLGIELAESGVSVTLLSPGYVESEIRQVDNGGTLHAQAPDTPPARLIAKVDPVAEVMVRAIERRVRERVITGHARFAVLVRRLSPTLLRWIAARSWLGRARSAASTAPRDR
jgi:short-subunit dehydrogenase